MTQSQTHSDAPDMKVFWCCFAALITTSFGFIVRAFSIGDWGHAFGLSATQQGEIFGVGLWPFSISIIVFSLIIDKIGYKTALWFAFICHVVSVFLTVRATGYWSLYWATFIVALGNGTVEAVVNPVVATMFKTNKAKWLNILHAGWPGGLVLAGLLFIAMGDTAWQTKVWLILIPAIVYGILLIPIKFPVNERVAAGVSYKDMLGEMGALGVLIVSYLVFQEIGRVFAFSTGVTWGLIIAATVGFWLYTRSLGRLQFVFLLLVMIPLAITELGTDSWVTELMGPQMHQIGLHAGWVIVYTSAIMVVLRFFAGPVVGALTPLGLLTVCSGLAAVGLFWLSGAQAGITILLAATLYGIAKSYFWPTMLGVVSERFPKGGALTLNATGGLGMLSAGVIGAVFLGLSQDKAIDKTVLAYDAQNGTAIHDTYVTVEKKSVLGTYNAVDQAKLTTAPAEDQAAIAQASGDAKKVALKTVAILPIIMLLSFGGLLLYFRSKGGYKPVSLGH
jgi:MFS family permease